MRGVSVWKVIGLASVAGVAATGVVVARDERRRREVTPDDVRDRLRARHARLAGVETGGDPDGAPDDAAPT